MVGLQLIAVSAPETGMGYVPASCAKNRIQMTWQPIVADLMANREVLEAVTIHMGRIADAELTADVQQHTGRATNARRQRPQLDIESAGDLGRING